MKNFLQSLRLLLYNFRDIVLFEIIYKLVANAAAVPFLRAVINSAIRLAGYEYISNRNLKKFLLKPSSAVIIVFVLVCISICTLFEISAVVYKLNSSMNHRRCTVADMFSAGADACLRSLKKENCTIILYSMLILPVTGLSAISDIAVSAGIPDLIFYYAQRKQSVFMLSAMAGIIVLILFIRWVFSIDYYVCEKQPFRLCRKKSISLIKGNFFKMLFSIILWEFSAFMFFIFISFIFGVAVHTLIKSDLIPISCINLISDFTGISVACFSFFAVPIIFSFICTKCSIMKHKSCEMLISIPDYRLPLFVSKGRKTAVFFSLVISTAFLLNVYYLYDSLKNGSDIKMEIFNDTQVTAHRGDSAYFPENTIPAFQSAIDKNSDWIELDVQEAMDGTIIVMHDSNFRRTVGLNKNVWDLSYYEIRSLDAGGSYIPTLEEVVSLAKGRIKLNIEIKPSGHEKNLERSVAEIISAYELENECIVSSFSASSLKKIKNFNSDIQTGYIMSMIIGDVSSVEYADMFSINSAFASRILVESIHNCGKQVLVWTVNSKSEIIRMKEYDVDNIITDNPQYASDILESSRSDTLMSRIIIYLFGEV